jgi:glycerol-3-phosphate cytidylyltransferase
VGLQTDPTIDRPNKNRPVQTVYERWVQLAACQYVDRIIPYATEKELLDILQSQDINIRFVGEEYQSQPFTGKDIDGIEIYYNKRRHSFSSTELRQRVFTAQITQQVNGITLVGAVGAAGDPATYIPHTTVAKNSLR